MIKVKIKYNRASMPTRETVVNITSRFNVKCIKLQQISDFFLLWCTSESDVDSIFSSECINALNVITCIPQLPSEMKAKRTVFLRQIDDLIQ